MEYFIEKLVFARTVGTGEVEAALFRHKQLHGARSALGNCVVVGAPDSIKGEVPVCFCVAAPGCSINASVQAELQALVIQTVGVLAAPAWFAQVTALPQTRTGKYLRRLLREIVCGAADSEDDESESGSHVAITRGNSSSGGSSGGSSSGSSSSGSSRSRGSSSVSSVRDEDDGALCNPESLQEARAAVAAIQAAQAMRKRTSSCRTIVGSTRQTSAEEGEEGEGGGEELRQLVVSLASDAVSWEVGSGQPSADDAKGHHDDHGFDDSADPAVSSQKLFVGLSTLQTVDFTDRLWT